MTFSSPSLRSLAAAVGATALTCLALLATPSVLAKDKPLDRKALTAVVERLTGAKVESIAPSPVAGLSEVIVNGKVMYIDATGKYLVDGHLVDIATRTSLTQRRTQAYETANTPVLNIDKLDLADAIKTVNGRALPGRVLVSFEDPRCGFCKKMHQTLSTVPDLVVYTFPLAFLGPQSREMNETIWCSADRGKAWGEAMQGTPLTQAGTKCDLNALDRNTALAGKFRVTGTPTLFTADGTRISGAVGAPVIENALLAAASKKPPTTGRSQGAAKL